MFKNVASQKLIVFAFDSTTNLPKTGDAANITAYVSKDYGTVTVLGDTSASEADSTNAKGYYLFDLTQSETNADTLLFSAKSSTANIVVVGVPATVFTTPASFTSFVTPTNLTAAQIATGVWQDTTAGDFTVALSIGKSVMNGVSLGTGLTVNALTTNNDKTGYSLSVTPPTSAQIATAVWQDSTAGDFTTASSIGKCLYINNVAPGGSGGLLISGSNSGTTTLGALTVTGAMTLNAGLDINQSTGNATAVTIDGNGSGAGVKINSGGGAAASGMEIACNGSSGYGLKVSAEGSFQGAYFSGGSNGAGIRAFSANGPAGLELIANSGHGLSIAAGGTSKHGLAITGGTAGTSDGINITAGTGGVGVRSDTLTVSGAITASNASNNIVGIDVAKIAGTAYASSELHTLASHDPGATLGTSTLTQTQVTGGAYALNNASFAWNAALDFSTTQKTSLNAATPAVTVSDKTGFSLTAAYDQAKTASQAGDAMTLTAAYNFAKGTVAVTESYAADGAAPTPVQSLMLIQQTLTDFAISGTSYTINKLDGSTQAAVLTLDDATNPTSATRSA